MEDPSLATVEAAHVSDLEAQEGYDVTFLKYWLDQSRGTICCLVETTLIDAFLGRGVTTELGCVLNADGQTQSAFRTVVFTDIVGSTAHTQAHGDTHMMQLVRTHDLAVRAALSAHQDREVKHTGDGIMAAFVSATAAVQFALLRRRHGFERCTNARLGRLAVSMLVKAFEPERRIELLTYSLRE